MFLVFVEALIEMFQENLLKAKKSIKFRILIVVIGLSNDEAVSSQFYLRSGFDNQRMGEPMGPGPMLRYGNDCLDVLLVLKAV